MKSLFANISLTNQFIFLVLIISMFLGLYFGEDTGGGGSIGDYHQTWPIIQNPFDINNLKIEFKFPLHYYIGALIYSITNSEIGYKIFYVLLSLSLPIIFFKCLEIKFPKIEKNNLFIISLILLLLPNVRTAAIWPNTQLTGFFFFLLSTYYLILFETQKNLKKFNKELMLSLFFLALAVYSRQIFALIYLYVMFYLFQKFSLSNFIKISIIVFIFAIPGIINIFYVPRILSNSFSLNLQNSILVNLSIISFYLIPIYFLAYFLKIYKIKFNYSNAILLIVSTIIIFFLSKYFNYNYKLGGGFFMKLSLLINNNFFLFFISSIIGLFLIYNLSNLNINNYIISLLIVLGIASSNIPQKYFEPMMFLLIFLFYDNKLIENFLKQKKAVFLMFLFYCLYYFTSVVNVIYKIKEKVILNII